MVEELKCPCGRLIGFVQGRKMTFETNDARYEAPAPVECRCECGKTVVWFGEGDEEQGDE